MADVVHPRIRKVVTRLEHHLVALSKTAGVRRLEPEIWVKNGVPIKVLWHERWEDDDEELRKA